MIHSVLPSTSKFSRSLAGDETVEQIVATNVDVIFLASALDQDMNVRRTERYLTMAWESGAIPVIVHDQERPVREPALRVRGVRSDRPGRLDPRVSSLEGEGFDELSAYLTGNKTVAVLGSSGVGKSTLINRLVGEDILAVRDIRDDGKGRHTTTHRQLVALPGGGLIMDTPGMRELQLWEADEGIDQAFDDIAELAAECKFRDCAHETEPGCAVLAAIESGELEQSRLDSYRKLLRELAALERKRDKRLAERSSRRSGERSIGKDAQGPGCDNRALETCSRMRLAAPRTLPTFAIVVA